MRASVMVNARVRFEYNAIVKVLFGFKVMLSCGNVVIPLTMI